ncbi:MAG: glucose-1-phosphate thymidylyltransferase RfbA [Methanomassiliicoccaceae archaeon]|jgi:glucose-1-phosphate thymidylyltransferase|nr:glucose-1-phosphate thymidylyltransferase RfbA [Methanomassiliicoccaceae archaeon]
MKGIILAAGKGTRLYPISYPISKILLPVYNKPMIYYPLSTLILAGIKEIMIITNKDDQENFKKTLGDGSRFGVNITYEVQYEQRGIADAFIIAEDFIANERVVLILGDNIYHGACMRNLLGKAARNKEGCTVFVYEVPDPERFGVAELDPQNNVISLEEKPSSPKSNYAVTGLYFYDSNVCGFAKKLEPSARGELEITDLNKVYLSNGNLKACVMEHGYTWLDAGTFESFRDAANTVHGIEDRTDRMVGCPEDAAAEVGFMTAAEIRELIINEKSEYYDRVRKRLDGL